MKEEKNSDALCQNITVHKNRISNKKIFKNQMKQVNLKIKSKTKIKTKKYQKMV